eukprot:m.782290 g.782290  ORF g.782290 m.782290 type:complete len:106 (+) comp23290_c0_seq7:47-364(+)
MIDAGSIDPHPFEMSSSNKTEAPILSTEQQKKLDDAKIQARIDDEKYLRSHPEIKLMMSAFTKEVLRHQPDDIKGFAKNFFTDNLHEKISAEQERQRTQKILGQE